MKMPAFDPASGWRPPKLGELPSWRGAGRVGIDIETRDPELKRLGIGVRRGGEIVGVSFSIEDGGDYYLPVGHRGGDNLDRDRVLEYLRDQALVFRGDLAGANMQYDLDYLIEAGVEFRPRTFRDCQIAEPLLDELQFKYSLEDIAKRRGLPGKDERLLREAAGCWGIDPKSGMWQLPARFVGPYAEMDSRLPLTLLRRQERELEDEDLWPVWDLESRLMPVLLKMRRRGVKIDFDALDGVDRWALREEEEALKEIKRQTGRELSVADTNKASALAPVLQGLGFVLPLTEKTEKPSVTSEVLDALDHPVAALMRRARKFNKLRTTFVKSIRTHQTGGRIHCTFNQLRRESDNPNADAEGARYGRCSSSKPNLQQQPGRDQEIGPRWRSIYVPDEGCEWACLDYSQQEPRWLIHFAAILDPPCRGAVESRQRYIDDPSTDNHTLMGQLMFSDFGDVSVDGLTKDQEYKRKRAKTIYLGLCYGMGSGKLARSMGLPTVIVPSRRLQRDIEVAGPEGSALLSQFHRGAPYVRELTDRLRRVAEKLGYIRTVGGRKCRFPKKGAGYDWTHLAISREVQGSSGDQMKKAMVDADDAGVPMLIQVHDELNFSSPLGDRSQVRTLSRCMLEAVECTVPHKVDEEFGPSWGEVKK